MEPSLSGDVLLLAVGDKAGFRAAGPVEIVLAGALMCGELMAGGRLPARPAGQPGRRDRGRKDPGRKDLEQAVQQRSETALEEAGRALVLAGVLTHRTHRVLGLFPRHGFAVLEPWQQRQAEERLRAALRPGSRPDAPSAALAVLCAVSGIARAIQPAPSRREDRATLAAHLNGLSAVVGADVTEVLLATRAAYGRSHTGDVFVAGDRDGDSDGYGDSDGGGGGGDGGGD